jgi:hypothetical protein
MDQYATDVTDNDERLEQCLQDGRIFEKWSVHCMNLFGQDVEMVGNDFEKQKEYGDTFQGHEMKHDTKFHFTKRMFVEVEENPYGDYRGLQSGVRRPYIDYLVQGNVIAREFWVFDAGSLQPYVEEKMEKGEVAKNTDTGTTMGVYLPKAEYSDHAIARYKLVRHRGKWRLIRKAGKLHHTVYEPHPEEAAIKRWAQDKYKRQKRMETGWKLRRKKEKNCEYNSQDISAI